MRFSLRPRYFLANFAVKCFEGSLISKAPNRKDRKAEAEKKIFTSPSRRCLTYLEEH